MDVAAGTAFKVHMETIPTVTHDVEPTAHRYVVAEYIREGLEQCFPQDQKDMVKHYITLATEDMIRYNARVAALCRWFRRCSVIAPARFAFRRWAYPMDHSRVRWSCSGVPSWSIARGPLSKQIAMPRAFNVKLHRCLVKRVKSLISVDYAIQVKTKAGQLVKAVFSGTHT